jgi:very-short-patch-repair endonuclease
MRKAPTRGEDRLWSWLRNRRFEGLKFRRQVPIGPYILDFYCAELKLAIELDGKHHQTFDMVDYDGERSRRLLERGIYVLRIANEIVIDDPQTVGEMIRWAVGRT